MNNITLAVHLLKKVKIPYKDWKRLDAYVKEAAVLSLQVYRRCMFTVIRAWLNVTEVQEL